MRRLIAVVLILVCASPLVAQEGGSGQLKGKFGFWEHRCGTPPGATREVCALVQSVSHRDRPNMFLLVIVQTAPDNTKRMRVVAPLGVFLPRGLGITVDNARVAKTDFQLCGRLPMADDAFGCLAEFAVDDALLAKLKSTQTAYLGFFFNSPDKGIALELSVAGLGDGIAKLN